ncbi:peptide/nickel transport system substrate-binding protein [Glycomyces sambucus]|uniref:Peptide/nickel transport system substrate-binding protein n=1 Tax=Glycomyces sambucus TaxID=380244 RepID=A0A1G9JBW6_9ACTN|nr:ABC transporter substrate-binding protein [Glycomyces sambucus]SDL34772.1 peptide/nickel transport system substrate-binding protein [Glycomyces sambucus]
MRTSPTTVRRALAAAAGAALAVGLFTACGSDGDTGGDADTAEDFDFSCPERTDGEPQIDEAANESQPFVFGTPGDPTSLDPILASDGETFRVNRQVFDTLLDADCTDTVPGLAESFEQNPEGTEWTFHLREGVTFHDGAPLDGAAVCKNFDRWANFKGGFQSPNFTYYYSAVFGGFAENDPAMGIETESIFKGCTADGLTATISISQYTSSFPGAFTLESLSIISPLSIDAVADVTLPAADSPLPEYTQTVGTLAGTGPYKLQDWNHSEQEVTLVRNDDYFGEPAHVKTLIFKTISDETARRQALEAGDIHGYDLAAPADAQALLDAGYQVPIRGVFNLLYLAYTQGHAPLEDHAVREALSYAVDRQRIVDSVLPAGGMVATQFIPPSLEGYSDDVATYEYDTDKAKELLAEAGAEDLSLTFCYPTDVTRPYMPAPKDIFDIIASDLEAAGVTVEARPITWVEYIPTTRSGECPLYLLGWTGDFADPYNFLGTWFAAPSTEWGFDSPEVFDAIAAANTEPDAAARVDLWKAANEAVMEELPGLPISSSPPSIAFAANVYPPDVSPLTREDFAQVSFTTGS